MCMKMKKIKSFLLCMGLAFGLTATAQTTTQKAEVIPVLFPNAAAFTAISDNGLWATAHGPGEDESNLTYPYLVDTQTGKYTQLWKTEADLAYNMTAWDVTNDGLVVGDYQGAPAYYDPNAEDDPDYGKWQFLPSNTGGSVYAVSADGGVMVGWTGSSGSAATGTYTETPLMWVRNADGEYEEVDVRLLPGFPAEIDKETGRFMYYLDKDGVRTSQARLTEVSADGNLIAGCMNYSTGATSFYVYNRATQTTEFVDNYAPSTVSGESFFSNNGRYVTGYSGGEESDTDASFAYRYDTQTGDFVAYNVTDSELDRFGTTVSNSGIVLACSPAVNPLRSVYIRYNNLWIALDQLLESCYGIDFYSTTNYEYTGLILGISDDEKTIIGQALTQSSGYIIRLPEPLSEAASRVNPLDTYQVFPAEGSSFSSFLSAQLQFASEAKLSGSGARAQLLDSEGDLVRAYSISAQANNRTFVLGGLRAQLTAGEEYTLRFPEGTFVLQTDENYVSPQIDIKYLGCEAVPAAPTAISPDNSAAVSQISTSSPVQMKFNMSVSIATDAIGYLYEEGTEAPITELTLTQSDLTTVFAYPTLARNLRKGFNYRVVIPANSITDVMGANGNQEITINYLGSYEREPDPEGNVFADDFNDPASSMATYLLYEGDHNAPSSVVTPWGFDQDNSPWIFVIKESDESSDYCAGSHSMYNPAGKSNDWMAIPQLEIENEFYYLEFDAQSYKLLRNDVLKVYVLADDNVYTNFPTSLYEKFKAEGKKIFEQQLTPGDDQDEEGLAGGWQHFKVSLADFAGKNIYIAFVNENDDQSAIFLDNLRVFYEGDFYAAADIDNNVVAKESMPVSVVIDVTGEGTFNTLTATCTAGDFTTTYTAENLGLTAESDNYNFTFPEEMPLTIGAQNPYTISLNLDGTVLNITGTVNDLAFETTKHVVVEESTGQRCAQCPRGILAFEDLANAFGDQFIPVAIHSSVIGTDLFAYEDYNSYFGITSQPNGLVNRVDTLYAPMYGNEETGHYEFTSPEGNKTWRDIAARELQEVALADINIGTAVYDPTSLRVEVAGDVNYALDMQAVNHNIVFVVLENGLSGTQSNSLYNSTLEQQPNYGEFAAGGMYGSSVPTVTYDHVARKVADERFGGISGLIPVEVKAGQPVAYSYKFDGPNNVADWANTDLVAMLIDVNTGKIINAAVVPMTSGTVGIQGVVAEGEGDAVISCVDGKINVSNAEGADVTVYDINGSIISKAANVNGAVSLGTNGSKGIFIVKVEGENVNAVQKVIVK